MISLEGRSIIVTGAAQGIGRTVAELIVSLGGNAILVDRSAAQLMEVANALGDQALALVGSVTDPAFVAHATERSVARFGAIHGLVNNAGITRPALISKMAIEDWNLVIDVNLTAPFMWLQAIGIHMIERSKNGDVAPGAIVNVSSDAGKSGSYGQINYAAAKAGILGQTMSAAKEWGRYNIRVNSVCFGVVETPMTETVRGDRFRDTYLNKTPLGRFASTLEVARPICFLLSDAASFITGQHLVADGGMFMAA